MKRFLGAVASACVALALSTTAAQQQDLAGFGAPPEGPPRAVPRLADGKPNLTGVWRGAGLNAQAYNLAELEGLYQPWAVEKMQSMGESDDPVFRCVPYSYPRAITLPWPFQIVQVPGLVVILSEYFHSHRIIPTDGRPHVKGIPTYLGDSVGRWEGDTLVVDVAGFNGETWLADGMDKPTPKSRGVWFTSDALHIVERWRLVDGDTLEYRAVVEDSKVLTRPWTMNVVMVKRAPIDAIGEGVCLSDPTYELTDKGKK